MPPLNTIFPGTATRPIRDFIAQVVVDQQPGRVVLPGAGGLDVADAIVARGYPASRIVAGDVTLFSCLVGRLAAGRSLAELAIDVSGDVAPFVPLNWSDPADFAAGAILAVKYLSLAFTSVYEMSLKLELRVNRDAHRAHIRDRLSALVQRLRGITFESVGLVDQLTAHAGDPDVLIYASPRDYKAPDAARWDGFDYTPTGRVTWTPPAAEPFKAKDRPRVVQALDGQPAHALLRIRGPNDPVPEAWETVFAQPMSRDRTDYVISSHAMTRRAIAADTKVDTVQRFPIYGDEDITPASVVTFTPVDKPTALYYRDLFVHRLGATRAKTYYLMLIDGRLVTALGLHDQQLVLGQSEYVWETFGISISSARYARLGKLFMLCLTSGDFKRFLLARHRAYTFREPRGIQTSSPTEHHEGKTDRSVMNLIAREPLPNGGFRVVYRADFRPDTWRDVLALWCRKWGATDRSASTVTDTPTGPSKRQQRAARMAAQPKRPGEHA